MLKKLLNLKDENNIIVEDISNLRLEEYFIIDSHNIIVKEYRITSVFNYNNIRFEIETQFTFEYDIINKYSEIYYNIIYINLLDKYNNIIVTCYDIIVDQVFKDNVEL